jgi:hypothetical protein
MMRIVLVSMLVGFVVPIFWGVLSFVLFNAPQSPLADLYWDAVHITSPALVITPSPFLNALSGDAGFTAEAL